MPVNQLFQRRQMLAKQILSLLRCPVGCAGFPAYKLLRNNNNFLLFQSFQVAGQVSVGQFEQLLQGIEIQRVVHHQRRHDSEPYAVIKYFLKI